MDFRILGPLEIRQDGRDVACRSAKQRLLLAALLLRANQVVSSDQLIEALWGNAQPATATKALQMHVSQLRRVIGPGLLVTRPPGYELRLAGEQLDLQRFESAVADARAATRAGRTDEASELLRGALALWRGQPLADLTFEDFLQPEIARLEELRLTALEDRLDADLALGKHTELVAELEALTVANPLRERLRGQLMIALYRSGRQADALEVYRQTRRLLVDELGLEPSRELKALEERILGHDPELEIRPPDPAADRDGLIGRDHELGELLPVVDAAIAGHGAIVLIGGEPGIGKSRLAETLARYAARRGARVAVGRCWEAGGAPPLWPWAQALQTLGGDERNEFAGLVEEPSALGYQDAGARFRMFATVTGALRGAAATTPLALFLDDLHAADAASLLLLRFVASQVADMPILVAGCFRDTESAGAMNETLAELAREQVVHRLNLTGLDTRGTASLLAAAMGARPADELVARVQAETRGNPLFAGEIGRLVVTEGLDDAGERLPIPEGVREAIRRRLQRQSGDCRELLTLAAVVGREFDLVTIGQVRGMEEDELLSPIAEAKAARLVGEVPGASERLRFSHILVRDVLYEDLPAPRRRRLHLALGQSLEAIHRGNLDAHMAALAYHFVAAGNLGEGKAAVYSERAATVAAAQYGYEEAARHYVVALDLLERAGAPDPGHVCDLLLELGDVQSRAGNTPEAKKALRRAAGLADAHGWDERLVRGALVYGGRFPWVRASTDPALMPMLERALDSVDPGDARSRARLLARLAAASRDGPSRERREELAEEAIAIGRRSDDPVALAFALEGYGVATEGIRPAERDLPIAEELIALGTQIGDSERTFTGRDFRLNAMWKLADRAGVEVEIATLSALADELNQPAQRWSVSLERAAFALMDGRFDEAEQLIADTREAGERAESWNARVSERLQLFVLRRAQGRLTELEDTIDRSIHEYPTLVRFRCALAHLYVEIGDLASARRVADAVARIDLTRNYIDAEWLFTVSLLPDVFRALRDEGAAASLHEALLPHLDLYAHAPIEVTFGSIARGLGVLSTLLRRFDDAEREFENAVRIERRMRARPWIAHAQHDFAAMLIARGRARDRARALSLRDDAVTTYRELGMASWADRASALG